MPALTGSSSSTTQGTLTSSTAAPLIAGTVTVLQTGVSPLTVTSTTQNIGDAGFGGPAQGAVSFAGSDSSNGLSFLAGMMGMF